MEVTIPKSQSPGMWNENRILFYDGECGLCTRSVRFLMKVDRAGLIRYAPLQGNTAREWLPEQLRRASDLSTVVYLRHQGDRQNLHTGSHAICAALTDIGGLWRVVGKALRVVPISLREGGYRFIAQHRLKISPKGACALPTQDERARLLD